jgi:hypothetical protein
MIDQLPPGHTVPDSYHGCVKAVKAFGPGVEHIDACVNGHMLFRGEHADALFCEVCNEPRYRSSTAADGTITYLKKRKARKVFLYFSLLESLRDMYRDPEFCKYVKHPHRHFEGHKEGWHRDLYDAELWYTWMEDFDMLDKDGRPNLQADVWRQNICISLSHDGIIPMDGGSTHSFWACEVKILNLPPSMRVQYKWMPLVYLIPGPLKPSSFALANVYSQPLWEELRKLYAGVEMFARVRHDMVHGEKLTVRGSILIVTADGRAHEGGCNVQGGGACRCVFCEHKGVHVPELDKHVYPPKARQYLAPGDRARRRRFYAANEAGVPPARRTVESLR